jgi:hypothetical protein
LLNIVFELDLPLFSEPSPGSYDANIGVFMIAMVVAGEASMGVGQFGNNAKTGFIFWVCKE